LQSVLRNPSNSFEGYTYWLKVTWTVQQQSSKKRRKPRSIIANNAFGAAKLEAVEYFDAGWESRSESQLAGPWKAQWAVLQKLWNVFQEQWHGWRISATY